MHTHRAYLCKCMHSSLSSERITMVTYTDVYVHIDISSYGFCVLTEGYLETVAFEYVVVQPFKYL